MTGQNSFWFANPSTSFYNGVATQSARFDGNAALNITHSSAPTDNTKGTVAVWIKLHDNNDRGYLIQTGSGTSNNTYMDIRFGGSSSNDGMHIGQYGRTPYSTSSTDPKQRDFSAWYHLLVSFDSTSATASERLMKIFINGVQVTDGTFGAISQNDHFPLTIQSQIIYIGRHTPSYNYFISANLADFHMIDGQALTPSSFTEIKNGICIPKKYTGSYGNNGFRLEFKQTGTSQNSSGIGADTSGNDNHWAIHSSTLSAYDSNMPDSPENNFAVLLPARSGENKSSQTFSEGNLQWTSSTYGYNSTGSSINIPTSGKWYWEVYVKTAGSATSHDFGLGIQGVSGDSMSKSDPATATYGDSTHYITRNDFGSRIEKNLGNVYIGTSGSASTVDYVAGDIISVAFDADSGKVYWGKNNVFWDDDVSTDGNPSAGTNETTSLTTGVEYFFTLQQYSSTYVSVSNFGQDSSFAGNKTAQNNTDANGIGDFFYAVPTDYLALCSANLPKLTISPAQGTQADDHFDTQIWSGDSSSTRNITSYDFQPDWSWIKNRTAGNIHVLHDSSRGVSSSINTALTSGNTDPEGLGVNHTSTTVYGGVSAFLSNGFTLKEGSTDARYVNKTSNNYVGWAWKANGGTTSSNSSGDITSTVQANQTAGFSIILYTGFGEAVKTVGHGLSQAPEMIWFKSRGSGTWFVYHIGTGNTGYTSLNTTGAYSADSNFLNNTSPTSSLITLGSSSAANAESTNFVAYAFHSVEGYSKFGTYIGNNSTDGTFVYTGFRPAWVLVKYSSGSGEDWIIWDNKRDIDNLVHNKIYANSFGAEITDTTNRMVDFLSNGYKHRTDHVSTNGNGGTYIYMAFAEQPFRLSNAR